jgi:hypothetical protein
MRWLRGGANRRHIRASHGEPRAGRLGYQRRERSGARRYGALSGDNFAFAPGSGAFQGVRTFGGQIKHLAAANYQIDAKILGEKPPHGEHDEEAPETVRTKSEILEYLKGSFVYLPHATATITENTLVQPIPGAKGVWQRTRLGLAVDAVAHSYDHYGQMVEYLRMNGVIPPASR